MNKIDNGLLGWKTKFNAVVLGLLVLTAGICGVLAVTRTISDTSDTVDTYIRNSNGKYWTATGANIQLACDDINDMVGGWVHLPIGNITITQTINLSSKRGFIFEGSSRSYGYDSTQGTQLIWGGINDGIMIDMSESRFNTIQNMALNGNGHIAGIGIYINSDNAPSVINNKICDILIRQCKIGVSLNGNDADCQNGDSSIQNFEIVENYVGIKVHSRNCDNWKISNGFMTSLYPNGTCVLLNRSGMISFDCITGGDANVFFNVTDHFGPTHFSSFTCENTNYTLIMNDNYDDYPFVFTNCIISDDIVFNATSGTGTNPVDFIGCSFMGTNIYLNNSNTYMRTFGCNMGNAPFIPTIYLNGYDARWFSIGDEFNFVDPLTYVVIVGGHAEFTCYDTNGGFYTSGNIGIFNLTNCMLRIPVKTASPTTLLEGMIYYNSTTHLAYCYNGTDWNALW